MVQNHTILANAIRLLSIDAVQKANSGHPGMPMGMADILTVLWRQYLRHNPLNPSWSNRDRFILSNGHGSMLQYAALHLSGYALTLEDLQQFRQHHSKTPGHPEWKVTPGVETSTGPLGQGLANAIGMALAEKTLAAEFNRPHHTIIDHYTYVFLGDGCLMEGLSHEVGSLAGTLKLGKLIAFWDNNGISIDGRVDPWFTENIPQRFNAYHWHVIPEVDGHDPDQIAAAIQEAQRVTDRPSLVCCKTQIGFGSPNLAGSHKIHGAPLSVTEVEATRAQLDWPHAPFFIPETVYQAWDARDRGESLETEWKQRFKSYQEKYPQLASEFNRRMQGDLPKDWINQSTQILHEMLNQNKKDMATRKASQVVLNALGPILPELLGGSADLSESNATFWNGCKLLNTQSDGNYLQYGVREFGMAAIMNGLALYGGFIPYGGTFLVFSDYARPAIRLAALMSLRVIFVLSHDSIGVGEDGPTHQPIEQLSSLRLIPNLIVWRPCDTVETAVAWQQAIQHRVPSCIVLTRQNVPQQNHSDSALLDIAKGGYILLEGAATPHLILIATGSEVSLAIEAAQRCTSKFNISIRVVSIPSRERFLAQDKEYQEKVLPKAVTKRIIIEAGSTAIWHQEAGAEGIILGIDQYGTSAPGAEVFAEMKLTTEEIIKKIQSFI